MEIINIDLSNTSINEYLNIVKECESIIYENLCINGGSLTQADIFKYGYNWTNLIIAKTEDKILGFLLIRKSDNNEHDLIDTDCYYYISDIAVRKKYQGKKIGTLLLMNAIKNKKDLPLVASALSSNEKSIGLLSKFMINYSSSRTGRYKRFADKDSYLRLYDNKEIDIKKRN